MSYLYKLFVILLLVPVIIFGQSRTVYKSASKLFKTSKINYPGDEGIDVSYYSLNLKIEPSIRVINGIVRINYKNLSDNSNKSFFDLFDNLSVDSVNSQKPLSGFTHSADKITLNYSLPMTAGENNSVEIYYHGTPARTGFGGFVFDSYNGTPWIWTLSEPYASPSWWPCKDDPSDKADSAEIIIETPKNLFAVSNGKLISVAQSNRGTKIYKWKTLYPVSNYLISITAYDFDVITGSLKVGENKSMEFSNYVLDSTALNYSHYIDIAKDAFGYYSKIFGEYPFAKEKYGQVEFGYGGGMEHQTITSLGSWNEGVIVHELAHQWFGDKITCANWHEIWLNEGFATYSESLYREHTSGFEGYLNRIQIDMNRALSAVGSIYAEDISSISSIFNIERTYSKGAVVLHMLRGVVGDSLFFEIIKAYANDIRLAYSSANTGDFKNIAESIYGGDLSWFFDEWIYGEGFPDYDYLYSIENKGETSVAKVTVFQNSRQTNGEYFVMPVELKFTGGNTDTTVVAWVNDKRNDYTVNLNFRATSMEFDPNDFVLKRSGLIQQGHNTREEFLLEQNYPNPFSERTKITYIISHESKVKLEVFNLLGQRVALLADEIQKLGVHSATFQPESAQGISSGVYFVRLSVNGKSYSKKMMLIR